MLRLIPKIIALTLALALVVIGGISVALPRLVNTEEFRAALHESAAEALGTPIEWSALDAGVVPLRLTISDPVLIAEATNRDQARLTAAKVDLRLSAMALLQNKLQVDSSNSSSRGRPKVSFYPSRLGRKRAKPSTQTACLVPVHLKGHRMSKRRRCSSLFVDS